MNDYILLSFVGFVLTIGGLFLFLLRGARAYRRRKMAGLRSNQLRRLRAWCACFM
jgi:hypothetical protein